MGHENMRITLEVPTVQKGEMAEDVLSNLLKHIDEFETVDYIYVLDNGRLAGVVSIRELLSGTGPLEDFMKREIVSIHPEDDCFDVPYIALSHGLKAVPMVDTEGTLLGVVVHDEILRILKVEADRNILHFGGVFHRVIDRKMKPMGMFKSRTPWLIIGVIGGTLTATLIGQFEDVLSGFIALASFIPVMVYMSDAAGTQSEALIIRKIAVDPDMSVGVYIKNEILVAALIASISAGFAAIMAAVTRFNVILGLIIFISMFLSIIGAVIISTISPLAFRKLGFDPAVATGPLATIMSDFTTTLIYLTVASSLIP